MPTHIGAASERREGWPLPTTMRSLRAGGHHRNAFLAAFTQKSGPPADRLIMAEIISCPSCQRKVQVPQQYLGKIVRCPECKHEFVAGEASTGVQSAPPPMPASAPAEPGKTPEWEKPRSRDRHDDDEEDDRPRRRRRARDDEDDDEDDDLDVSRRRRRRRYLVPHRGGMVMTFGIMSLTCSVLGLCCGLAPIVAIILGPIAWVMGGNDLARMRQGEMDSAGQGMVQAGRVMGIIGLVVGILMLLVVIGMVVLNISLNANGRRF